MSCIYISFVVSTAIILTSLIFIRKKNVKPQKDALAVLQETRVTLVLAFLAMGLSYFLLIAKLYESRLAGDNFKSYLFIAFFALTCALVGSFTLLWTLLKKGIVYKDRLLLVSYLGHVEEMAWSDVTEVKVPMLSKKAIFKTKDGSYGVYGDPKEYKRFIEAITKVIKPSVAGDTLKDLLYKL